MVKPTQPLKWQYLEKNNIKKYFFTLENAKTLFYHYIDPMTLYGVPDMMHGVANTLHCTVLMRQ